MPSNRYPGRDKKLPPLPTSAQARNTRSPPRPRTAQDYIPTPISVVQHTDTLEQLLNDKQKSSPVMVHRMPPSRFTSFSQLPQVSLALEKGSKTASGSRSQNLMDAAHNGVKRTMSLGIASVEKTAAAVTPRALQRSKTNAEGAKRPPLTRSGSYEFTYLDLAHRDRLPKLVIPDLDVAVEEALNSARSSDTDRSILRGDGQSPTSDMLKYELYGSYFHTKDVEAELRNMLSARRRVRKGKFGSRVNLYQRVRDYWDHELRSTRYHPGDVEMIGMLTKVVQKQKDHATRLVQENPSRFPGLRPVSEPGCTREYFWHIKSTYK